jgi:hypothetical protein
MQALTILQRCVALLLGGSGRAARSRRCDVGRPRLTLIEIGRRFGGGLAPVVGRSLMLQEEVDRSRKLGNAFVQSASWPQCP